MEILAERRVNTGLVARVLMSDRRDGDLSVLTPLATVEPNRQRAYPGRWTWLRQVHGSRAIEIRGPGDQAGTEADAAVTVAADVVLAAQVADCVPVAFIADEGVVGVAHAGWRGLEAGVLEETVALCRRLGANTICAVVGPSIGPECYEFGAADLDVLVARFGPEVAARTRAGTPALDMGAAVGAELARLGVSDIVWANPCTACHESTFWSHRARGDRERQAMIVALSIEAGAGSTR